MTPTVDAVARRRSLILLAAAVAGFLVVVFSARMLGPDHFYVTEREWQTAVTTMWISLENRGLLDAPTPLMGPPWHIPMEFPLFQWLAAELDFAHLSLPDTGRVMSLLFFLLQVAVFRRLALDLDLEKTVADASAALVLTSPLFVAYAFSYTIESLASLLALTSLWAFIRWLRRPSLTLMILAVTTGCAASLTKGTTWAVFAAATGILALWAIGAARRHGRSTWDTAVGATLVLLLPLACGLAWVRWSDAVKAALPLVSGLTSTALVPWNYGTVQQKLSLVGWGSFVLRSTVLVVGPLGFVATIPAMIGAFRSPDRRPPFPAFLACLTGLAVGPLVFTNLFFVHDYYALAPGLFAVLLFASVFFSEGLRPWALTLLMVSNLAAAGLFLAVKQANYSDPLNEALAETVSDLPTGSTYVLFGSYLDGRVALESRRRALQTTRVDRADPELQRALAAMENHHVGAVITRNEGFLPAARSAASRFGLHSRREVSPEVWILWSPSRTPGFDPAPIDLQGEVAERLLGFTDSDVSATPGLVFPSGPAAAPGIGLAARNNLYLFDTERGLRVIHHRWRPPQTQP